MKRNMPKDEGFTLVELLVVILIIGILSAIAIPAFLNQRQSAVDTLIKADIRSLSQAQESYIVKNPQSAGTISAAELHKTVAKLSDGVAIGVWAVDHVGYCLVGYNKGGEHFGGQGSQSDYIWYDSALGGFVEAANYSDPPIGGACQNPRPEPQQVAWLYSGKNGW